MSPFRSGLSPLRYGDAGGGSAMSITQGPGLDHGPCRGAPALQGAYLAKAILAVVIGAVVSVAEMHGRLFLIRCAHPLRGGQYRCFLPASHGRPLCISGNCWERPTSRRFTLSS